MKFDVGQRVLLLVNAAYPLSQHNDFHASPFSYDPQDDVLYLDIIPRPRSRWADVAYGFSQHEGMKYDRDTSIYGIDGQPRVSYSGLVWVRFIGDFIYGSRVALNIVAPQPSHSDAEEQLGRLYGIWQERDGLEPMEAFRKFF